MPDPYLLQGTFAPGGVGLGPFPDLVRTLLGDRDPESVPADGAPWVAPALRDVLGVGEPRDLSEIYSAIAYLLDDVARGRPILIRLDGWDRAGPAAVNLVAFLSDRLAKTALEIDCSDGGAEDRDEDATPRPLSWFVREGNVALERSDLPTAYELLSRAIHMTATDEERLPLIDGACEALVGMQPDAEARSLAGAGLKAAIAARDDAMIARFELWELMLGEGGERDIEIDLKRLATTFAREGDDLGSARANEGLAHIAWAGGDSAGGSAVMELAVEKAANGGSRTTRSRVLAQLFSELSEGPQPVQVGIARCLDLGWVETWSASVDVVRRRTLGSLFASLGEFDRAREHMGRAKTIQTDLGQPLWVADLSRYSGWVELVAGDAAAAEAEVRAEYQGLEEVAHPGCVESGLILARALCEQTDYRGAVEVATRCIEILESEPAARTTTTLDELAAVQARALVATGLPNQAQRVIPVVDGGPPPGRPIRRADQLIDLSHAVHLDDPERSRDLVEQALAFYEGKGATACTRAASQGLR